MIDRIEIILVRKEICYFLEKKGLCSIEVKKDGSVMVYTENPELCQIETNKINELKNNKLFFKYENEHLSDAVNLMAFMEKLKI